MINRAAITLEPKQPMIDWINANSDEVNTLEAITGDLTLFLIDEVQTDSDFDEIIKLNWEMLFEHNLEEWYEDKSLFPQNRTLEMFDDWFSVRNFSIVQDLVGEPIVDDEG